MAGTGKRLAFTGNVDKNSVSYAETLIEKDRNALMLGLSQALSDVLIKHRSSLNASIVKVLKKFKYVTHDAPYYKYFKDTKFSEEDGRVLIRKVSELIVPKINESIPGAGDITTDITSAMG